jgi:hypothetical protein
MMSSHARLHASNAPLGIRSIPPLAGTSSLFSPLFRHYAYGPFFHFCVGIVVAMTTFTGFFRATKIDYPASTVRWKTMMTRSAVLMVPKFMGMSAVFMTTQTINAKFLSVTMLS